jgi:hypothetical protein
VARRGDPAVELIAGDDGAGDDVVVRRSELIGEQDAAGVAADVVVTCESYAPIR